MKRIAPLAAALASLLALAACDRAGPGTSLSDRAVEAIRADLADDVITFEASGLGRARLTPEGDLVIGGRTVPMDESQRAAALAFRAEYLRVAEAGAAIAVRSAALAKDAVGAAVIAAIAGDDDADAEAAVRARTARIEEDARRLCESLPRLRDAQQALADAVPEFLPYARLDEADWGDCSVG